MSQSVRDSDSNGRQFTSSHPHISSMDPDELPLLPAQSEEERQEELGASGGQTQGEDAGKEVRLPREGETETEALSHH